MDITTFLVVSGVASVLVSLAVEFITRITGIHGKPAYALVALTAWIVIAVINYFIPDLQTTIQSLWGASGFMAVGIYEFLLKEEKII